MHTSSLLQNNIQIQQYNDVINEEFRLTKDLIDVFLTSVQGVPELHVRT